MHTIKLLAAACILQGSVTCNAAEIKVYSDGPLRTALSRIVPNFQAQTGHSVEVVYGTAPALKAKITAGEKADVLISLSPEIEEMVKSGVLNVTQPNVASIKLGLAVRKDAPTPDITTLDNLKRALLNADAILHNNLASGRAFAAQLDRIGLADQLKPKIVVVNGNRQLEELAKRTDNAVAGGQLTQLIVATTVKFAGALPPQAQSETVYSAGVFSTAQAADAAKQFIQFLVSPKAVKTLEAVGAK